MVSDDLATQGIKLSAAVGLKCLSRDTPGWEPEGLRCLLQTNNTSLYLNGPLNAYADKSKKKHAPKPFITKALTYQEMTYKCTLIYHNGCRMLNTIRDMVWVIAHVYCERHQSHDFSEEHNAVIFEKSIFVSDSHHDRPQGNCTSCCVMLNFNFWFRRFLPICAVISSLAVTYT